MPRTEFQRQLEDLRDEVLALGEVVVTRLRKALTALREDDPDLAQRVLSGDHEINERYLELESDCISLFALQQPVASDLRFIAASFKILTDLERVADLAANLAGYKLSIEQELVPEIDLLDLGEYAVEMVEDALGAYAGDDAEACHAVAERDDELDGLCERASQRLIRNLVERDPDEKRMELLLTEVTRILLTIRDIERVGDHAVNVAARTLYMVESDDSLIY